MDLITNVKVSGINSLTDARYFSGAGVQYVGFCFDKSSPRSIATEKVFQIKEWLAFPEHVAEFNRDSTVDEINNVIQKLELHYVELVEGFSFGIYPQIEVPIIQRISVEHLSDIDELEEALTGYPEQVEFFILDFKSNGFEWNVIEQDAKNIDLLKNLASKVNIMIDVNITTDNVERIIDQVKPFGIELEAGNEIKTGVQSFEEIADVMELLEASF